LTFSASTRGRSDEDDARAVRAASLQDTGEKIFGADGVPVQTLEHSNVRFESIRFVMRIDSNRFV